MNKRTSSSRVVNPQDNNIPETLTKAAACDVLHCSLSTVDRLIATGAVKAYRIGKRHILIDADDVRAYFAQPANYRVIA